MKNFLRCFVFFIFFIPHSSFSQDTTVKVLVVIAHPDDDAVFAGTVYKITHALGGIVDYALITNGEGGYKYSTLSEDIYGLELTDEETGREHLPLIRRKELEAGGKIVGVRNFYYLNQRDHKYTTDITEILDSNIWDLKVIKNSLAEIIKREMYDYIFILIPTSTTHAHHSSAGILTLQTVNELDISNKPVVLGGSVSSQQDTAAFFYKGLDGYPVTKVSQNTLPFVFDRTQKFGYNDRLDYKIIVNWLIAEHKSQGTMQLLMNRGDYENYWYFDINPDGGLERTRPLFEKLKINHFKEKTYDE
jgi:LmbE family N-acetylglucosaminyl deacetylase